MGMKRHITAERAKISCKFCGNYYLADLALLEEKKTFQMKISFWDDEKRITDQMIQRTM